MSQQRQAIDASFQYLTVLDTGCYELSSGATNIEVGCLAVM